MVLEATVVEEEYNFEAKLESSLPCILLKSFKMSWTKV